ncbi:thioredoxin family protein [Litoribacter populi]|uniref:thioredoxin family protein n=1 Tax=Litoribacter populi TaxID=2598460 RepID=UPI00117E1A29|nr:thioredoxin family protein [Litoribacter populi]
MAKKNFKDTLLKSQNLILVDFHADWCAPCQTLDKVVEDTLIELNAPIELMKINIDQNKQAALSFSVRSIPHLILFKKGKIVWQKGGLITKRELEKALKGFV